MLCAWQRYVVYDHTMDVASDTNERSLHREPTAPRKDGGTFLSSIGQDIRYAFRMLAKSPAFAAIAILTLALGIGANTALFSVVNGVLLNPLPYPHPSQLVALYGKAPGYGQAPVSYPNFLDWQRDTHSFSSIALYHNEDYNFTGTGEAERVSGYMIS